MGIVTMEHSGVLVLRAWVEGPGASGLRARIIATDAGLSEERVTTASTVDEVCAQVRSWLEELLRAADGGEKPSTDDE